MTNKELEALIHEKLIAHDTALRGRPSTAESRAQQARTLALIMQDVYTYFEKLRVALIEALQEPIP